LETDVHVELLNHPRRVWLCIALTCLGLLSFGMYLQHVVGLEPCPMCIVQRYVMVLMGLVAVLGAVLSGRSASLTVGSVLVLLAGGGAYVAARQTWLQWYPPEVVSCGRDFYGMIETFPLQRAIPMIFKGGGDCSNVDWTFLGGSIANWSFVAFVGLGLLALAAFIRLLSQPAPSIRDASDSSEGVTP
jgi:disulfide bond formation protein DsbB